LSERILGLAEGACERLEMQAFAMFCPQKNSPRQNYWSAEATLRGPGQGSEADLQKAGEHRE